VRASPHALHWIFVHLCSRANRHRQGPRRCSAKESWGTHYSDMQDYRYKQPSDGPIEVGLSQQNVDAMRTDRSSLDVYLVRCFEPHSGVCHSVTSLCHITLSLTQFGSCSCHLYVEFQPAVDMMLYVSCFDSYMLINFPNRLGTRL
jgi:hypothetical protein